MILHLTNSAISGAAAMLADAQRAAGHDAACLQFGALKPEKKKTQRKIQRPSALETRTLNNQHVWSE